MPFKTSSFGAVEAGTSKHPKYKCEAPRPWSDSEDLVAVEDARSLCFCVVLNFIDQRLGMFNVRTPNAHYFRFNNIFFFARR
jgi:hypothetical protein